MWMLGEIDKHWEIGIGGLIGAAVIKLIDKVVPMVSARWKFTASERKDLAAVEAKGNSAIITMLSEQRKELRDEVAQLREHIIKLDATWEAKFDVEQKAHFACRMETAALKYEVESLRKMVHQQQKGQ